MNRQQFVALNYSSADSMRTVNSEPSEVLMGVPQGSILIPVLFCLYINELDRLTPGDHFSLYADDTSVIVLYLISPRLYCKINVTV